MSNINKAAVLNPFTDLTANILDYVPRATTSEFGIVAIGSGINVDHLGRIYLDTQEYSDRLSAVEAQAASTLATQKSEVAAAIAQVNLSQSQTITALTLEVDNLKTNLTDAITATQTELIDRADQLAQDVTDITVQLTQDKATFTQEIQDALDFLKDDASVASALRTPRKINGTDFDGRSDITTNAWGATRTIKIGNKTNSINGSSNVAYSLADIGAFPDIGGTIQGDVEITGNLSVGGTISATLEGNAGTATKLQTPRTINGVSFDGSANISLPLASTSVSGTVQLNNTLTSTATDHALTAAQGKALNDTKLAKTENAISASKLQTSRTISLTGGVTGSVSFDGSANASIATTVTGLGAANGIATLDSNGQVPSTQLPSYVDDVLEYESVAAFPTTGEAGKIYVETTGNTTYRWGGTAYVKITSGEVASVAGKTGVVTLSKADVGLANVDNTPDAQKPISVAMQQALDTKADNAAMQLSLNDKVNKADVIAIANGGTGATTLEDAKSNLGISSVRLLAGTDLNNIINEGTYFCDTDANSASMPNCPLPYAFTLQVYITAGIVQRITYYHGANMLSYRRAMYNNQWRSWDRELSENFPSKTIELQALNETSNDALIRKLTKGTKSGFFFNGASGTAFKQYSAGFYASSHGGAFSAIATDIISGEVRTLSAVHRESGAIDFVNTKTLLAKGDYGIGSSLNSLGNIDIDTTGSNPDLRTGVYDSSDIVGSFVALNGVYGTLLIGGSTYNGRPPQYAYYNSVAGNKHLRASAVHTFRTTQNTWVDGNGFIKAASPVVELYANEIKLNNEAKDQDIVFEKVDVGSYLLKGTTGLAQDGWYIEQPKDSNGNIFHAVEYGTHTNGDIWIKTYEQMMDGTRIVVDHTKPVDIKESRFITIRLNELPKDTTAPPNPTVVDSEGNPAPSKYHVLEEGVWVISDENAAILEQERLAAMKPLKRRQFRLTLAMNGYDLNEIEALIDQIEDPMQRTIAQIEWQDATDFERTNPTLLMLAELMQLTSEQVDQLWNYGLTL